MTSSRLWRAVSHGCKLAAVGCVLAAVLNVGRPAEGRAQSAAEPATVSVTGSLMGAPLAYAWARALSADGAPVRLDYTQKSSQGGRQSILEGLDPVAMSPIWFNKEDQATIAEMEAEGKKPAFVEVPVAASALVFAELPPPDALKKATNVFELIDVPPPVAGGYTSEQFLRMYFERIQVSDPEYARLHGYELYSPVYDENNPDAEPPPPKETDLLSNHFTSVEIGARVGPTAMGYMLERAVQAYAPKTWEAHTKRVPRPDGPSEQIDLPYTFGDGASPYASNTYDPMITQSLRLALQKGSPCCLFAGLTPLIADKYIYQAVRLVHEPEKSANLTNAEIEASVPEKIRDRWRLRILSMDGVAPTPENIAKAVVQSDGLSTRGATLPPTNGGYPYSYVHKLIVRTDELSVDEANAVSDLIRWIATKGQAYAPETLDVPLPPFHVKRALDAANLVVRAACPAERVKVAGTNPVGTAGVDAERCVPAPPPTTTTTTTVPTTSTTAATTTTAQSLTVATARSVATTSPTVRTTANEVASAPLSTRATTTTTQAAPAPTTTTTSAPTTTGAPPARQAPPPTESARPAAREPQLMLVTPVGDPPRQRSTALQSLLGAVAFTMGSGIANRRAGSSGRS